MCYLLLAQNINHNVTIFAIPGVEQGNSIILRLALDEDNRRVGTQLLGALALAGNQPLYRTVVCEDKLSATFGIIGNAAHRHRCNNSSLPTRVPNEYANVR